MRGALELLRQNGLAPCIVVDVGAHAGTWSRMAAAVFPETDIHMFEANQEKEQTLQRLCAELGRRCYYHVALLGAKSNETITFYVQDTGSSVLPELTAFPRNAETKTLHRLDDLLHVDAAKGPILLKLDVQGYELEVLKGASGVLEKAEAVILEISLLPYNQGAPLAAEVINWLAEHGFVLYDFCGQARRETDSAVFQCDVVFVAASSPIRAHRPFWQQEEQFR